MNIKEFFDYYMQELDLNAASKSKSEVFMDNITDDLIEDGEIEEFNYCHYSADKGVRVDGYSIDPDDQNTVRLFISDLVQDSEEFESINKTEVDATFKRLINFYSNAIKAEFLNGREETSPEYNLSLELVERKAHTKKLKLYLLTNKKISDRIDELKDSNLDKVKISYQIWDLGRIYAQHSSDNSKEILKINFLNKYNQTIPCLHAHDGNSDMESYLAVMPGKILADLYENYGNRLLEANVRCFLQQKGKVNKGIKHTIIYEPEKFFAFNNGLTATAQDIKLKDGNIEEIIDLQIVNGAQTTASLFHTLNKEQNIDLEKIYVQMKLSVMPKSKEADDLVVNIARYANTQNKVTDADFFTNHPYHQRIEEKSRRKFLDPKAGEVKPTKWWYERARGSYNNEMSLMTVAEKRKFQKGYPSKQKFTKTDLAKYENVWDEDPKYCNLGASKNFAQFAKRISNEWEKNETIFNDNYYSRLIARAIIFKNTEKIVSNEEWYSGGYRANIVYYTIAIISQILKKRNKAIDHMQIWKHQEIDLVFINIIEIISKHVNNELVNKQMPGLANIGEKAKKDIFWKELQKTIPSLSKELPKEFFKNLKDSSDIVEEEKEHISNQIIDNSINVEIYVMNKGHKYWKELYDRLLSLDFDLSQTERDIFALVAKPGKLLSEKQCKIIKASEERAADQGVKIN